MASREPAAVKVFGAWTDACQVVKSHGKCAVNTNCIGDIKQKAV